MTQTQIARRYPCPLTSKGGHGRSNEVGLNDSNWTRRRFLAVTSATAARTTLPWPAFAQQPAQQTPQIPSRSLPPEVISGGTQPLLAGHTARPLRYTPQNGEFVIRNGREYFNRPIYGISTPTQLGDFRVDAGDLPEFSLYLPGHGGNLKLGFIAADGKGSKWGAEAEEIIARYRPGRMIYELRDPLLGKGSIHAELLTANPGPGLMLKVEGHDLPAGTRLAWAFGGVSGRKGRRGGDIGCEVQPVSEFFQLRPEECEGNEYTRFPQAGDWTDFQLTSKAATLHIRSRPGRVAILGSDVWNSAPAVVTGDASTVAKPSRPILVGSIPFAADHAAYLTIVRLEQPTEIPHFVPPIADDATDLWFAKRSAEVEAVASALKVDTPDPYINASAAALSIAAETIWDQKQQCVMHGGVAWRQALAGWRGPYVLDVLGQHDRTKQQIRHWLAKQNSKPIDPANQINGEATGAADPNVHLTRHEHLLHSNGDVSNNHYDMNLVFFDMLLRHLMGTGDVEFAREIWPALQRHLAWEHRLFRRTYKLAATKTEPARELPLYEAYAAIWASDNLQYNGGGAAHSSAYMVFALRKAAQIAKLLSEDPAPYTAEADDLYAGMQHLLWDPHRNLLAESKDILGPQTTYTNPALWTVYHAIDSEAVTPTQTFQMCTDRLAALKPVPIHGPGVPGEALYMLACSDWMPYVWSLNLLLMGENMHFALALWQAGIRDHAFRIFKGQLLDSMYMGLCPGNFHMTSALDAHRQEAQRDFGDPIGCSARALLEGLFGIQPDLLTGRINLRPGFPDGWDHATLKHPDFDLSFQREGARETWTFTSRLAKPAPVHLFLPARGAKVEASWEGDTIEAVMHAQPGGGFRAEITLPEARDYKVEVEWSGPIPAAHSAKTRNRTKPAAATASAFLAVPALSPGTRSELLDLTSILQHNINDVFTRGYTDPRSPFCSLSIPDGLLGGWANPDGIATIDDAGLRAAKGTLQTPLNIPFCTPATGPNCRFVSHWKPKGNPDQPTVSIPLTGRATGVYLLVAGTTLPQCSRMQHGTIEVTYLTGLKSTLPLRNPENWWPIEQDYLIDDYLFLNEAPLPPRVDLRTGQTRLLDPVTFKGKGRTVKGGAATILHLPLEPSRPLHSLTLTCELYGVVLGLLAATLTRT